MKAKITIALLLAAGLNLWGQGTVVLNNHLSGTIITHVYYNPTVFVWELVGNGTDDLPPGTKDWTGFTPLTGSGWMAALLAAPGAGVAESSLTFGANPTTTSFRSGVAAGGLVGVLATLSQVPPDAAAATLELFVWNNNAGTIVDPSVALAVWKQGTVLGGLSGAFTVNDIGGSVNTPPNLPSGPGGLQSFAIVDIPEPSVLALAGIGAGMMVVFWRKTEP